MANKLKIKISKENVDYFEAMHFMKNTVNEILNQNHKDLIWFLNHDHIYTCGRSADQNEILNVTDVPIIQTNRGGKTTYHGPGQRVVYLMINLNKKKKDVRKFISVIERSIIKLLKEFNIESKSFPNRVGIWIIKNNKNILKKEKKIAAIGLRIKKWVTYHGLSFNIKPDLKYYNNITSCGLKNYASTSLEELGIKISQNEFDDIFLKYFKQELSNL